MSEAQGAPGLNETRSMFWQLSDGLMGNAEGLAITRSLCDCDNSICGLTSWTPQVFFLLRWKCRHQRTNCLNYKTSESIVNSNTHTHNAWKLLDAVCIIKRRTQKAVLLGLIPIQQWDVFLGWASLPLVDSASFQTAGTWIIIQLCYFLHTVPVTYCMDKNATCSIFICVYLWLAFFWFWDHIPGCGGWVACTHKLSNYSWIKVIYMQKEIFPLGVLAESWLVWYYSDCHV